MSTFESGFLWLICLFSIVCPALMLASLQKKVKSRILFLLIWATLALLCFVWIPLKDEVRLNLFFSLAFILFIWALFKLNTDPAMKALALCRIAALTKGLDTRISLLIAALQFDDECPEAYYLIAQVESELGNKEKAIINLKKAEDLFWRIRWDSYLLDKTKKIRKRIEAGEKPEFEKMILYIGHTLSPKFGDPYEGLSDQSLMEKASPLLKEIQPFLK